MLRARLHGPLGSLANGEDLHHLGARHIAMLEPNRPAGVVWPQVPVPLERKLARLAYEQHDCDGLAVGVDGRRQRVELHVQAREAAGAYHQPRSPKSSMMAPADD